MLYFHYFQSYWYFPYVFFNIKYDTVIMMERKSHFRTGSFLNNSRRDCFLVSKNVDVVWRWEFSFDLCGIILCIDIQLGWVFLGYCWFLNSIDVYYFGSYLLNWSLSWYHYFCFAYLIGKRYLLFCFDLVGYFTFFRLLI